MFREHIPEAAWTSVETGGTAKGVADSNYLFSVGIEGWIEYKATRGAGMAVTFKPGQAAWLQRRARMGGRSWVAVRRAAPATGLFAAMDELWLVPGAWAIELDHHGLDWVSRRWHEMDGWAVHRGRLGGRWAGGVSSWHWGEVERALRAQPRPA